MISQNNIIQLYYTIILYNPLVSTKCISISTVYNFYKCFSLAISSQPDNVFIAAEDLVGAIGNDQVIQREPVLPQSLLQLDL